MARIGNPRIVGRPVEVGGEIAVRIAYEATFEPFEKGLIFDDAYALWEDDGGGDRERIQVYQHGEPFVAVLPFVSRSKVVTVGADAADTEIGEEEITGRIWLRRRGAVNADDEVFTPIVKVNT